MLFQQRRVVAAVCFAVLVSLFSAGPLTGQGSAYLTGYVRDPSSAAVPSATVTIKNESTGASLELKTNETGIYRSPALAPGTYEIRVAASGFQESVTRGVILLAGQPRGLDVGLQVGAATQIIEVLATAPLLKTEDAGLGQNVQYQQVASLPYFNRSAGVLLSFAPTVRYTGEDVISYGASRYNVGAYTNVNVMVDGASVVGNRTDVAQMVYNPTVEALTEVKVTTNQYSAEFGRDVGALVQMVTKSGANSFHGGVYEYFRNEKLDTMNAFSRTRPVDRQHMFGGTIGGRILRDKLFFFSSFEPQKATSPAGFLLTVPTAAMKTGNFSALPRQLYDPATTRRNPVTNAVVRDPFPGNIIPSTSFDSSAVRALAFMPNPTLPSLAGNLPVSTGTKLTKYRNVNRVDWNISDKDRLTGSYMFDRTLNENLGVSAYNAINRAASPTLSGFGFKFLTQVWNITEQHTFSPKLFMSNRFVHRPRFIERVNPAVNPSKRYATNLGIRNFAGARLPEAMGGDLGFPTFNFTGYTGLGPGALLFQERPIKETSWDIDLTYVTGKHTFKFGFQTEFGQHGAPDQGQPTGNFSFGPIQTGLPGAANTGDGFASFLLGQVDSANTSLGPLLIWHNWYYASFIQDDWKISPSFTLNLGLRWDIDAPVYESKFRGNFVDFYERNPVSGTRGVVKFLNRPGYPARGFYNTDYNRLAPRIGFAWQPKPKFVVRGG
ncbi:MAG: TonB-dependent receptor, partial [Acidobacteria bacterium]|nr:TonB-dependent receptor [Acidobacteriota bacterium]